MAEENQTTLTPELEGRLDKIEDRLGSIENRVSRLEGLMEGMQGMFEQMSHRMTSLEGRIANLESGQRWILGLVLATWVSIMLAVVGLYFKSGL